MIYYKEFLYKIDIFTLKDTNDKGITLPVSRSGNGFIIYTMANDKLTYTYEQMLALLNTNMYIIYSSRYKKDNKKLNIFDIQEDRIKLLATSDLHLAFSNPAKDMAVFGDAWTNYTERIKEGWNQCVNSDDIVIIAGDISWANNIEQAKPDLDFIEALPGKKIITIGNHDFWHQSSNKSNNYFFDNYETMVPLVRNDYINLYGDTAICAVKGHMNETHPEFKEDFRKSYERECRRLENTLKIIPSTFNSIIVASHYPPIHKTYSSDKNKVMNVMSKYNVDTCIYGHLHDVAAKDAYIGHSGGIEFTFVAGDSYNFEPLFIKNL